MPGRRVGAQAVGLARDGDRAQAGGAGAERLKKTLRVLVVEHAVNQVQRLVVPAAEGLGQDLSGSGVVAAVEPQFPGFRQGVGQRPASAESRGSRDLAEVYASPSTDRRRLIQAKALIAGEPPVEVPITSKLAGKRAIPSMADCADQACPGSGPGTFGCICRLLATICGL